MNMWLYLLTPLIKTLFEYMLSRDDGWPIIFLKWHLSSIMRNESFFIDYEMMIQGSLSSKVHGLI